MGGKEGGIGNGVDAFVGCIVGGGCRGRDGWSNEEIEWQDENV